MENEIREFMDNDIIKLISCDFTPPNYELNLIILSKPVIPKAKPSSLVTQSASVIIDYFH